MADSVKYQVVDPFRQTKAFNTETQGRLATGTTGYIQLKNKETADEIKAKAPWCQVFPVPQRNVNGAMFTMPALPYETEWDRKHKKKEVEDGGS